MGKRQVPGTQMSDRIPLSSQSLTRSLHSPYTRTPADFPDPRIDTGLMRLPVVPELQTFPQIPGYFVSGSVSDDDRRGQG